MGMGMVVVMRMWMGMEWMAMMGSLQYKRISGIGLVMRVTMQMPMGTEMVKHLPVVRRTAAEMGVTMRMRMGTELLGMLMERLVHQHCSRHHWRCCCQHH